ncbi:MAG: MBL fold metallo-hydrolase [Armatimonadetes bacterium]|nr:MBL fold metallo-hydrolase [Armatimonadota bacterium]
MAEIALTGADLIRDIGEADPPRGSLAFWWLGQNGFAFKGAGVTIYVDLYLKDDPRRATPVPFRPEEVVNADFVLGTHDHGDHVDRTALPGILAASPDARIVVSQVTRARLVAEGYPADRVVGLDDGEALASGDCTLSAIRAAHEFFDRDPELGYPHLGFVISLNGVTLFHAGDGVPWEGLISAIAAYRPDIVFVPINGRDGPRYRRGCIGNFTFQEAADLCGALQPKLCVPMHYDMFPGNQERVESFTDYLDAKYPGLPCWVGRAGERVVAGPW